MKSIFIISLFCFSLFAFTYENSKATLKIEKTTQKVNNKEIIRTILTNSSNDTLYYFTMSCSWAEFYSTDNKSLNIVINECDKNIPKILKLAPHNSNEVLLEIMTKSRQKKVDQKIRIGFNLIEPKHRNLLDFNRKELNNKSNIIWSNEITF